LKTSDASTGYRPKVIAKNPTISGTSINNTGVKTPKFLFIFNSADRQRMIANLMFLGQILKHRTFSKFSSWSRSKELSHLDWVNTITNCIECQQLNILIRVKTVLING
jgi:hypothetical protein